MIKCNKIDNIATRLTEALPEELKLVRESLQQTFVNILQSSIHKMDLVTREEFDVQAKILARTREKLQMLEQQVTNLENSD